MLLSQPTAWYFLTLEIAFKPGNILLLLLLLFLLFALKKSEQAEIVAFNRLLVNCNIFLNFIGAETRQRVLTVVTQVIKKYGIEARGVGGTSRNSWWGCAARFSKS